MIFFKPEPNLSDGDRARIEFQMLQVVESVGIDRFRLPVLRMNSFQGMNPQRVIDVVGQHLSHDVRGIVHEFVPLEIQKKGGG